MIKAALFDIDGTLILTDHAGIRALAFTLARHDPTLSPDKLPFEYSPHGKTDPLIFRELFIRLYQRNPTADESIRLREHYLERLPHELAISHERYRVMPGAIRLLEALHAAGIHLGLGTGNFSVAAKLKLEQGDLNRWFRFGGYGDDAEDRADLIRAAIRRGRELLGDLAPQECVVIGDTSRDIDAAHAAGARSIGVATGAHGLERLKHADLAVPTLESPAVYEFFGISS